MPRTCYDITWHERVKGCSQSLVKPLNGEDQTEPLKDAALKAAARALKNKVVANSSCPMFG